MRRKFFKLNLYIKISLLTLGIISASPIAQAKVFDYQNRSFGTYLRGTFGTSKTQQNAYQPGMPAGVSYSGTTGMNQSFSGEIGAILIPNQKVALRLGVELIYPQSVTGATGLSANGTTLFSMDSTLYSIVPEANVEFFLKKTSNWRFYVGGGAGYAITTFKNTYTLTAAGTTQLGVQNYIEEASGWGILGNGFVGVETNLFDNVGLSFDAGYRYLMVSNYTSNRSSVTPLGTLSQGSPIKNSDGSNRSTDLSGIWASAMFVIYF